MPNSDHLFHPHQPEANNEAQVIEGQVGNGVDGKHYNRRYKQRPYGERSYGERSYGERANGEQMDRRWAGAVDRKPGTEGAADSNYGRAGGDDKMHQQGRQQGRQQQGGFRNRYPRGAKYRGPKTQLKDPYQNATDLIIVTDPYQQGNRRQEGLSSSSSSNAPTTTTAITPAVTQGVDLTQGVDPTLAMELTQRVENTQDSRPQAGVAPSMAPRVAPSVAPGVAPGVAPAIVQSSDTTESSEAGAAVRKEYVARSYNSKEAVLHGASQAPYSEYAAYAAYGAPAAFGTGYVGANGLSTGLYPGAMASSAVRSGAVTSGPVFTAGGLPPGALAVHGGAGTMPSAVHGGAMPVVAVPAGEEYFSAYLDDATPTPNGASRQRLLLGTLAKLLSREGVAADPHLSAALVQLGKKRRGSERSGGPAGSGGPGQAVALPVEALLKHPALPQLTANELHKLLAELVKDELIEMSGNGQAILPLMQTKRRTVIIRDPREQDNAYHEFILKVCPHITHPSDVLGVYAVVNPFSSAVFITFRTEELAQKAALWLNGRNFNGQTLRVAIKNESQYSLCQLMPSTATQGVAQGMAQGVAPGMSQGVAQGVAQGVPQSVAQGMPRTVTQGMPQSVAPGMARNAPQSMAQGLAQGAAQGMAQGAAQGMAQGVPGPFGTSNPGAPTRPSNGYLPYNASKGAGSNVSVYSTAAGAAQFGAGQFGIPTLQFSNAAQPFGSSAGQACGVASYGGTAYGLDGNQFTNRSGQYAGRNYVNRSGQYGNRSGQYGNGNGQYAAGSGQHTAGSATGSVSPYGEGGELGMYGLDDPAEFPPLDGGMRR
ncbi:hypothetical protein GNI_029680 [Gregarina niphandrodes]|uniref:RNA recognition motif protein n=1 Tax=Gregarina niphandrodes TaxID=110365 RepID=A0A023BB33_GRENI|nr:hypothetical protein GNI_029680 [Gregarina niphandrodes]EZG79054.1 hypothetical protein GNI_029680 [Gregarina niphandrodes]|eukprot:XP_011129138.1 hypothetical protein GNI_029680 [Gregarina niphandrodes]